jgi:hypothetical protein
MKIYIALVTNLNVSFDPLEQTAKYVGYSKVSADDAMNNLKSAIKARNVEADEIIEELLSEGESCEDYLIRTEIEID